MEHITISHSGESETGRLVRLNQVKGYLSALFSPVDLKVIISLHDHKGALNVTLDKNLLDQLNSIAKSEFQDDAYTLYLQRKIKHAWHDQGEDIVEFEFTVD